MKIIKTFLLLIAFFAPLSCAPLGFVSIRPEAACGQYTPSPLPLIAAVGEMPSFGGKIDGSQFRGDLAKATRAELIRWLHETNIFWYTGPAEDLPGPVDVFIRPKAPFLSFSDEGGGTSPVILSILTVGIYPLAGGSFYQPKARFVLGLEVEDGRGGKITAFTERADAAESLSLYGGAEDTPGPTARRAFGRVLEELSKKLAASAGDIRRAADKDRTGDYDPPVLVIENPKKGAVLKRPKVAFKGRVLAREGVCSFELRLNGQKVSEDRVDLEIIGGEMVFFSVMLETPEGVNIFECRATDDLGREERLFVRTTRPVEKKPDAPAEKNSPKAP